MITFLARKEWKHGLRLAFASIATGIVLIGVALFVLDIITSVTGHHSLLWMVDDVLTDLKIMVKSQMIDDFYFNNFRLER